MRRKAMSDLASRECIPCRGGVPPLEGEELAELHRVLGGGWEVVDGHHLEKTYRFPDFRQALDFTNRIGELAERVGPSPRYLPGVGSSEGDCLDAQDRWPRRRRLHLGREGRPVGRIGPD